ncbi:uncharacterized protein LOC111322519 [Stylophora pistillata]|uniref:uncharacterized protein LOC111322519 n=1 Tax=Stylophora pistillata TaxID=50429 RepID=UPI000C04F775|nr:uncharacterized protein LOC111322519 [Stylophora pistillata]
MAALSRCTVRSLKTKRCLISSLGGSHLPKRSREVTLVLSLGSLQVAQRTYCSPVKETSEEDLKNRPIRFSTSRARSMTVGQTLGERKKSTSMVTVYMVWKGSHY